MVLGITSASQELALQEQGETLKGLEQAVEAGRRASRWRGSKLKVSRCLTPVLLVFS
jgi:hypothetical protein